jgi:telomere length regulation protein
MSAPQVVSLALSPAFISGIGHYIGHLDYSIRRCGMLVAEVVAHRAGKKLDFGDWDGDDTGKPWARELRLLITARDVDADIEVEDEADDEEQSPLSTEAESVGLKEIFTEGAHQHSEGVKVSPGPKPVVSTANAGYDSDDSLTGYASSSSRSTSPTPSELEEIEHDPTLRVGIKKIPRPVYLVQLGELVRSTSGLKSNESEQEADKIEMALNCGEELVRKKQGYGVELGMLRCRCLIFMSFLMKHFADENAANLVYGFVGLQDNFELDGFEVKRQGILIALVACCPRIAAL